MFQQIVLWDCPGFQDWVQWGRRVETTKQRQRQSQIKKKKKKKKRNNKMIEFMFAGINVFWA